MCSMQVSKTSLEVGGSVTLTALMEAMQSLVKALPKHQTCTFRAMLEQLKYFAGVQIRNAASVAGNICTGSPISDLNPLYMAAGAVFTAVGKGTPERQVGDPPSDMSSLHLIGPLALQGAS